jgi:hypothetical protein
VSNSLLQFHQKELEELKSSLKRNEKEKELHDDKAKNVARETSEVIQSIKNVYFRCQSTMRNKSQLIVNTTAGGGGGGGGGGSGGGNNASLLPSSVSGGGGVGTTGGGAGGAGATSHGHATAGASSSSSTGSGSSIAHLSELLSLYLDIVHSRVSDLIEISNEYKVAMHVNNSGNSSTSGLGSLYSINGAPSQLFTAPSGMASMNLDAGFATGVSRGNSQFEKPGDRERDRNAMSRSAPSGQMKAAAGTGEGTGIAGGGKSRRR